MIGIKITGLDELRRQMSAANFKSAMRVATLGIATEIQGILQEYPPATAANRPGRWRKTEWGDKPQGYYERNRGWWYPLLTKPQGVFTVRSVKGTDEVKGYYAFGKARGVLRVKDGVTVKGYRLASGGTSESLGKKWFVKRLEHGAQVYSTASYAPYVQADSDQARRMREIGWRTDRDAARQIVADGTANKIVLDAVTAALRAK